MAQVVEQKPCMKGYKYPLLCVFNNRAVDNKGAGSISFRQIDLVISEYSRFCSTRVNVRLKIKTKQNKTQQNE